VIGLALEIILFTCMSILNLYIHKSYKHGNNIYLYKHWRVMEVVVMHEGMYIHVRVYILNTVLY